MKFCKAQDDIWFYLIRIKNNVDCYINNNMTYSDILLPSAGLFSHFNSKNNLNTTVFHQVYPLITPFPVKNDKVKKM